MAEDLRSLSDEETDRSNDDAGTGRSYECVFCKRGFTTAQALGGHMNIHRKDRAKPRPSSTDYCASLRRFPVIQTYPNPPPLQISYHTFIPAAAGCGFQPPIGEGILVQSPQEDWRRNLSLQIGPSGHHLNANREDDELDLELRLGHLHP